MNIFKKFKAASAATLLGLSGIAVPVTAIASTAPAFCAKKTVVSTAKTTKTTKTTNTKVSSPTFKVLSKKEPVWTGKCKTVQVGSNVLNCYHQKEIATTTIVCRNGIIKSETTYAWGSPESCYFVNKTSGNEPIILYNSTYPKGAYIKYCTVCGKTVYVAIG